MMLHALVVTGWPQKMLRNNKSVIFDLVIIAGPAGCIYQTLGGVATSKEKGQYLKVDMNYQDMGKGKQR